MMHCYVCHWFMNNHEKLRGFLIVCIHATCRNFYQQARRRNPDLGQSWKRKEERTYHSDFPTFSSFLWSKFLSWVFHSFIILNGRRSFLPLSKDRYLALWFGILCQSGSDSGSHKPCTCSLSV